ncbi:superoxide dismutase family protein [Clostridium sp. D2Q-14]|uniref:superoxide dismutase family protein n=1 Tax=Anaeromonas gelatinilytica TaxID=2683194 RepID=UPI00193BB951|nr:superoxide dismutase family protein [Anaeromonas gelatinilytica]MBS4534867.1 superoxide dismutase family protein [Anaeromonas gelatinilytica]
MYYDFAIAEIHGGPLRPQIKGYVSFQKVYGGVVVCANVQGLPEYKPANNNDEPIGPFGFHIHEGKSCAIGDPKEPFQEAGEHYNPRNVPHGNHPGDFPVLVASNGCAQMCFFIDKFTIKEVLGRAIIIHQNPDDYRSQPTGNAGKRLACGIIKPIWKYR